MAETYLASSLFDAGISCEVFDGVLDGVFGADLTGVLPVLATTLASCDFEETSPCEKRSSA